MKYSAWGNYPIIEAKKITAQSNNHLAEFFYENNQKLIPRGFARSYGDSALQNTLLSSLQLNRFIYFDETNGILTCESGVSFYEIIQAFLPQGWFPPVTPGTKFVSLGGAIAADVHGKNHHIHGSISNFIQSFDLVLANGEIKNCSRTGNPELFWATIGGMGLTGFIYQVQLHLKKINSSWITQKTIANQNLEESLQAFEQNAGSSYSVSWLDTVASGKNFGRSLLFLGEHSNQKQDFHQKPIQNKQKINIPIYFPNFTLNKLTISLFNKLYFALKSKKKNYFQLNYDTFFYPLDSIGNWNRIYGKAGFLQYQFVVPKENGSEAITKILQTCKQFAQESFLTVLKKFGKASEGWMSFPREGYTLAMDFPRKRKTFLMLEKLDEIVLAHGGRVYLVKDARLSAENFQKMYPNIEKLIELKHKIDPENHFISLQWERISRNLM